MTDNFITVMLVSIVIVIIFGIGASYGTVQTSRHDNQLICKQLHQKNTNDYINCNTKVTQENIKLIKDISNDR